MMLRIKMAKATEMAAMAARTAMEVESIMETAAAAAAGRRGGGRRRRRTAGEDPARRTGKPGPPAV